MKNYSYRFSVFTATYNRADKLVNLYNDILNQTYKDFEWVVVNDGSTDHTDKVMQMIISENRINIQYISQVNGGKHSAWRTALQRFKGRYVTTFDDDDPIKSDALEIMDKKWQELESSPLYDQFWEIRTRCDLPNGELLGPQINNLYLDSDYNEMTYNYGIRSEMNSCAKVEVLMNEANVPNKFYIDDLASNFPECIRWSRAARKYKTRFLPDITRTYIPNESGYITSKSLRTLANNLVTDIYILNEQRDLLFKYCPYKYLKYIAAIAYYTQKLSINNISFLDKEFDRYLVHILKFMTKFLYLKKL